MSARAIAPLALLLLAASPARSAEVATENAVACYTREPLDRIAKLLDARDIPGIDDVLGESLDSGLCRPVKNGASIRIQEKGKLISCVAPTGTTGACVWMPTGYLKF